MFHKIKRSISFFALVGLVSAIPAFANPEKGEKARKSEGFSISLRDNQDLPAQKSGVVTGIANHSYRLSLKQGETISFKLNSSNRTSVKVKSPSGIIKQTVNERIHEGVLSGEGEFVFEISAAEVSTYRLEVKRK